MTHVLKLSLVALLALAGSAEATGMKRKIYQCGSGATIAVNHISMSPPGGPIAQWYEASVTSSSPGGALASGSVKVTLLHFGSEEVYSNSDAKFDLRILAVKRNDQGVIKGVYARASFLDANTATKGTIAPRWMSCR